MSDLDDTILSTADLSCSFGGVEAVAQLSFDVPRGAATGVIGPNGAGKTTLFNLVTGFVRPSTGTIFYKGGDIGSKRPHELARLGIGRTFQTVRVFGELDVRDNLRVADSLASTPGEGDFATRAERTLGFVGLPGFEDEPAGSLSYGQQKLLEIGMVLINRPDLVLLDEPVAGVNPLLIEEIAQLLRGLLSRGITLLIVEHNIAFVTSLCDRILVMANGRMLMEGTGDEVQSDRRVLEAFLGG